ncbi:P-loop containing nucleoside triphosphate hydrolase protein [Apodospora peruviana]|uniref:P-loop containing nucleoside triphosphate hydrolase protein n=1 Tax=Apodospora peruviana TaxID=516989 RepID=A0AAE0HXD1_9PEZI|nr:P-loop containing nucleoside triphosphate hydrolase protein [Apodospora peruviana]
MAFQSSGLPTVAAATAELWPSIANTLLVPWRGPTSIPSSKTQRARRSDVTTSSSIPTSLEASISKQQPPPGPAAVKAELPDFLRDEVLPSFNRSLADIRPTNIVSEISNMSTRSLAMASPLFRRPFPAPSRPLGLVGLRAMSSAAYQPRRIQPLCWAVPVSRVYLQSRSFMSGGVPRSILANREAAANRNPGSATAQALFYQLLLKANMPALVVERYQSGRFATNEVADEAYQKALSTLNGSAGGVSGQVNSSSLHSGGLTPSQAHIAATAAAANHHGGNMAVSAGGKAGRIHVVVDETGWSSLLRWIKFFLWFGLVTYLSLVVVSMVLEGINLVRRPGSRGVQNTEAKAEHQKTRFSDVYGCDEAKEELQELVDFLRNPEKFSNLGGKMPKGVLLVGPPGTGKTLLARAVAGEAGVPFFYMSGSEFEEVYVGVGAQRVRELFSQAKAKSPSIVFIDELDAIGGKRNSRDATYVRQTLNQLLTELDGFDQNSGVIFIAATNFPESLDKALTRPGRFDRHVAVTLPDVRGRIEILKHHAKRIKAAADVNLEAIASRTPGLSGAELENIVNQAAVHASKLKARAVSQKDFEWAKDKVIMGTERKSMVITPKEKEMTAYHEAGHALVAYYAKDTPNDLYKVTVLPRGQTLGHTAYLPEMDKHSYTVKDYMGHIDRAMGGKVAEEIVYGNELVTSGVSNDLDVATQTAWSMVAQLGMSEKLGPVEYLRKYNQLSSETRAMVESEVKRVLDEGYERARTLLVSKRKELDLLAMALVEYETLDKSEVEKVLRGEKLPDRISVPPGPMTVPKPAGAEGEPGYPLPPIPGNAPPGGGDGGSGSPPPAPPPPAAATSRKDDERQGRN